MVGILVVLFVLLMSPFGGKMRTQKRGAASALLKRTCIWSKKGGRILKGTESKTLRGDERGVNSCDGQASKPGV